MEPALRFREPTGLAQVNRYCQRNVKKQFPVVIRIRPMQVNVNFLRERNHFDKSVVRKVIETFEEVLFQALLPRRVHDVGQGAAVELGQKFTNKWVEKILIRIPELTVPMTCGYW